MFEPEDDFVVRRGGVERPLLLEEDVARAQQFLPIRLGEKARPRLDPVVLRDRAHHQRVAECDLLAGQIGAARRHQHRIAIVDMEHGGGS